VPRDEELLVRFVSVGSAGELRVPGVSGMDPAGIAQARGEGTLVIGYESRGSLAELPPDKTALYVQQEGLATQLSPAQQQSLAARVIHDRFARSVKALLVVGTSGDAGFDRVLGLPLELVPLADPSALGGGGALPLRLLYAGKPLPSVQVTALSRTDPLHPVTGITDARGEVTLSLPRGGEWLIKAVRVTAAPAASGADLESVWTSLTFEVK